MSDPAIRVDGLTKYFGPVIGVEELSFEVERGEIYGFLGSNGAGKTTTIRLLLDLLRPTRGRATVLGRDCRRESLEAAFAQPFGGSFSDAAGNALVAFFRRC